LSRQFFWELNGNGLQMIFAGRVVSMCLGLLLAALLYRWSRQLFTSRAAALLTLLLFTFSPNVLAHSGLATTDLGFSFFLALAAFCIWQFWRRPLFHAGWYLAAGVGIGLAFAAKFSGIVLIPAVLLMALYRLLVLRRGKREWGITAVQIAGWFLIAAFIFLALYRFNFDSLWLDFSWQQKHQLKGHQSYFLGQLTYAGSLLYFPVLFAAKTPAPLLFLIGLGLIIFAGQRRYDWERLWPLLLAGGVAGAGMVSKVNIGYRYLLPALPFLYLFLGQLALPSFLSRKVWRYAAGGALAVFLLVSLRAHPHYLAYFNTLAGGPDNGWRIAVDSNIDWGQDLSALKLYMAEHGIDFIHANWLGSTPLAIYDISGGELLGWPLPKDKGDQLFYDWFYPPDPQPGAYAISVTQLVGVYLEHPDRFAWFREREPAAKAGYSIFIYDVPPDGPPVGLGLSGIPIAALDPADYAALGSNDVTPRWFDARSAFLWPGGGGAERVWTAVGDAHLPQNELLTRFYPSGAPPLAGEGTLDERTYRYYLYEWPDSPITAALEQAESDETIHTQAGWSPQPVVGAAEWVEKWQPLGDTAVLDDAFQFLGWQTGSQIPGQPLSFLTFWRVLQPPEQNVKIFVHLLDESGRVVSQNDGLDVRMAGLHPGDEMAQLHILTLPSDLPPGRYALQIGMYDADTLTRLSIPAGSAVTDRLLLEDFRWNPEEE
ncbi:MAG TPA: phospholipid carrier-dependent glycosyltransferase, partial [Chloroflexi bacterium]|nr:phospholipid carrier-dependent glycosyltransferase [Chloroflexota bacterium]